MTQDEAVLWMRERYGKKVDSRELVGVFTALYERPPDEGERGYGLLRLCRAAVDLRARGLWPSKARLERLRRLKR
jgi:hypothetical protein